MRKSLYFSNTVLATSIEISRCIVLNYLCTCVVFIFSAVNITVPRSQLYRSFLKVFHGALGAGCLRTGRTEEARFKDATNQ